MRRLLQSYGFAFLILVALACSCLTAGTVDVPEPVPDFALRAAEIYRLEIAAAFFVAFYLVTLTFLLALSGRGFAEFGSKGLKVDQVVRNGTSLHQQREIDRRTEDMLGELDAEMKAVLENLASHQKRLERIETRR